MGKRYLQYRKDLYEVERLEAFLLRRLTVKGENFEQALAGY